MMRFTLVVVALMALLLGTWALAQPSKAASEKVAAAVYWDKDRSGARGKGEPLLKWPVELARIEGDAVVWSQQGTTTPAPVVWGVTPGTYDVAAAVPIPEEWGFTTPSFVTVSIEEGDATVVLFGVDKPHMK